MFRRVVMASVLFGCAGLACGLRVDPESPDGGQGRRGPAGEGAPRAVPWASGARAAPGGIDRGQRGRFARGHRRFGRGHRRHGHVQRGGRLHALQPVSRRTDHVPRPGMHGHRDGAGERHRLRHEHGVQQRRVRGLRGRGRLHHDERVPDRRDLVRDGRARLHGDRRRGEWNRVRDGAGLPDRKVRGVSGGRCLRADESLPCGHARLRDGIAGLHGQEHQSRGGNRLRNQQGLQRDRHVHGLHGRGELRGHRQALSDGPPRCAPRARRSAPRRGTSPTARRAERTWCAAPAPVRRAPPGSPARRRTRATPARRPARRRSRARTRAGTSPTARPAGRTWSATTARAACAPAPPPASRRTTAGPARPRA